jgi:hypothetical protein
LPHRSFTAFPTQRVDDQKRSLGFKYIGNTALNLVEQGYNVLFGYEEAIGFMFSSDIPDKDGVAATVGRGAAPFPIKSEIKNNESTGAVRRACRLVVPRRKNCPVSS